MTKQAAEEKRSLVSQRLREYAQLRYLLDHRPSALKSEDSSLLDELARVIVPSDISLNVITRSIDTVLAIYQGGSASSTIKTLTGRTTQDIRETLEQLIEQCQTNDLSTPQQSTTATQSIETVKQTPLLPHVPPTTPASSVLPQREQNQPPPSLTHTPLIQNNPNDYPLKFDTRNQNIPLQQIIQDNTFFPVDLSNANNNQQESTANNQSTDSKQLLQTFNNLNPSMNISLLLSSFYLSFRFDWTNTFAKLSGKIVFFSRCSSTIIILLAITISAISTTTTTTNE